MDHVNVFFREEEQSVMVIKWKERYHDEVDREAMENRDCIDALRNCRLLKFFITSGIRAQPDLLQYLINIWDMDQEMFILGDQELEIKVVDIYFITGLSRRGERLWLTGAQIMGESMDMLIGRACSEATRSSSGNISISIMANLLLKIVLYTISHVAGAQAPHEATKAQLQTTLDFIEPTIFNWSEVMVENMKK